MLILWKFIPSIKYGSNRYLLSKERSIEIFWKYFPHPCKSCQSVSTLLRVEWKEYVIHGKRRRWRRKCRKIESGKRSLLTYDTSFMREMERDEESREGKSEDVSITRNKHFRFSLLILLVDDETSSFSLSLKITSVDYLSYSISFLLLLSLELVYSEMRGERRYKLLLTSLLVSTWCQFHGESNEMSRVLDVVCVLSVNNHYLNVNRKRETRFVWLHPPTTSIRREKDRNNLNRKGKVNRQKVT